MSQTARGALLLVVVLLCLLVGLMPRSEHGLADSWALRWLRKVPAPFSFPLNEQPAESVYIFKPIDPTILTHSPVGPGGFSGLEPAVLRFSDGYSRTYVDDEEDQHARTLRNGEPGDRVTAARALWRGHSRNQALAVLSFVSWSRRGDDDFLALQREVNAELQSQAILRELREGDFRWGAWKAGLRPHSDLVPELLDALKNKTNYLSETILALGQSRDKRALKPLIALLKNTDDFQASGVAALALGYLGEPSAEPELIDTLSTARGWIQVRACGALAKIGTAAAVPALRQLADSDDFTGIFNIKGRAREALDSIAERQKR